MSDDIQIGDVIRHFQHGIGRVVWMNERRQSGHILVMFRPNGFWERLFPKAKDTYMGHVRKLNALELLALETA